MDRESYFSAIAREAIEIIETRLNPASQKVGYSESKLEEGVKWRPTIMVLGNYSSGKSTFINDVMGMDVQKTGQAPTDDGFSVIIEDPAQTEIEVISGKSLLEDERYPFENLRKYGDKFASHLVFKKIPRRSSRRSEAEEPSQVSFLQGDEETMAAQAVREIALIDSPGMLDSITEGDRGYDYQGVIGDLASMSDLILIFFDPHKAGTIRETYESLRNTLPSKTFEDRIVFVLNRIDECSHLPDLLRVYGTLCWNLSQMLGRKDIPPIYLTYSQTHSGHDSQSRGSEDRGYLQYLKNERRQLIEELNRVKHRRLENLVSHITHHARHIDMMASSLLLLRKRRLKWAGFDFLIAAVAVGVLLMMEGPTHFSHIKAVAGAYVQDEMLGLAILALAGCAVIMFVVRAFRQPFSRLGRWSYINKRMQPDTQNDKDIWARVGGKVKSFLSGGKSKRPPKKIDFAGLMRIKLDLRNVLNEQLQELRSAIDEAKRR